MTHESCDQGKGMNSIIAEVRKRKPSKHNFHSQIQVVGSFSISIKISLDEYNVASWLSW